MEQLFREAQDALAAAGPLCQESQDVLARARQNLEVAVHLGIRTQFLAKAHAHQWTLASKFYSNALTRTKKSLETVTRQQTRFQAARGALEEALGELAATPVQLRVNNGAHNLREFVDEDLISAQVQGKGWNEVHEEALNVFRVLLPEIQRHGDIVNRSKKEFEREKAEQTELLVHQTSDSGIYDLLNSAEACSEDMANLLQSLARHYDLCERGQDLSTGAIEAEDVNELGELRAVLENDAQQLPDVLDELQERLDEVKQGCQGVHNHMTQMYHSYSLEVRQLEGIQAVEKTMDATLEICETQQRDTKEYLLKVQRYVSETSAVVTHYQTFLNSYKALLHEAERRNAAEAKMKDYVTEVNAKLAQMSIQETNRRQDFVAQQGDYLPADIWDELLLPSRRFEARELDGEL
ncbi:autophagy-related protein 17 [Yarrowia lipolytica]|jgi:autophagy-related protein 17|uniref:Autophagy-related protein 17 n=1 Tax=Yarrowia lipolytica TaxID=4952 RepID=A0A371CBG9_YARLL|nr:autophagy-related protein 17 [Yarrowia lipolytica]RDW32029.1 autophagy-related protein 17 [Yarrowia lipolytica]RDW49365.1 autophagy-related protein 17 [Yarrowia lipolytica]RDW51634.1 autophagy-related protein 17 [Yarrowia lipolytica]